MGNVEENEFVLVNERYGRGVCVNHYKGEVSICQATQNDAGEIWLEWCHPQRNREPMEKAVPWGLRLGPPDLAAARLKTLARIIKRGDTSSEDIPW